MSKDPVSVFGGLLRGCISDRYLRRERSEVVEGILLLSLGVCSSVVTTYLLSSAGILV